MSGRRFYIVVAIVAVLVTVAQSITIMCDAASLFTESRGLFMATSNATAFDREFALALHKHCWPSLTADGQEGIVHATEDPDSFETKLDQHLYDLHDRLHELNQLLAEKMSEQAEHEEEEGHETEEHDGHEHEEEGHETEVEEEEGHETEVEEEEGHEHEEEGHALEEEENTSWDREMEAGKIVPE